MILIRVDLPAPLSPARARTSPGQSVRETSFSACTPPNRFETFSTRNKGSGAGASAIDPILSDLFLNLIYKNGDNDYNTYGNKLPKWLHVHKHKSVLNHGNDQRSDYRTNNCARPAKKTRPSDHHRSDTVQ